MKKIKFVSSNLLKMSTISAGILIPSFFVASCSNNSIESKLEKLLNEDDLFDFKLNVDKIKEINNINKITLKNLFLTNTSIFSVVPSQKMNDWNNNLSEEDKLYFTIKPEISGVILPKINNDDKLTSIKVMAEISTGNVLNKFIEKEIDLTQYANDFDLTLKPSNNYFEMGNSDEIPGNELWNKFTSNIISYIKSKNIIYDTSNSNLNKDLTFHFGYETNIDGYTSYQSNMYSLFDGKQEDNISIIVYTNDKEIKEDDDISTKNKIKNECISFKLIFNIGRLNN